MMRSVRRLVAAVVLSALTAGAGVVAGCGSSDNGSGGSGSKSSNGPVTLTFANWASAEDPTRPGMLATIKAFEKLHPNITIKSQAISFTDIGKNLVLASRSGNPPDVAELSGNDTFAVAATQSLANLNDLLGDVKGQILPQDITAGTVNGAWVAMPWTDAPQGMFVNKKLLAKAGIDKPPTTLDEFDSDMATIKSKLKGVIPFATDTTNRSFGLASQLPWMKAFGAQPFDANGKVTSTTPEMQKYLQWIRDVVSKGYTLPNRKIGDFRPLAAQDKVAFIFDQPLLQGVIQTTNHQTDKQFYDTWEVTPQPQGDAGQSFSVPLGHQLVVFKKAVDNGKSQAAAEFVKYLATNTDAIKNYTIKTESSQPPLKQTPSELSSILNTPVFTAFQKDIAPTLFNPPYGPVFSAGFSPAMAGVQNAFTTTNPIDMIATDMQTNIGQATA